MDELYVKEGARRFPCSMDYMLAHQGTDYDPFSLIVRDEDEADFWNGLRFVTGHKLIVTIIMDEGVEVFDSKVYFTFSEEETVYDGNNKCWRYRKLKS